MKILFSVYKEDHDTGNTEQVETVLLQTDWSIQEIDEHIALYDGFRSEILVGEQLSFCDYYCFFSDVDQLIEKIKTITISDREQNYYRTPCVFRIGEYNPGNADTPYYPPKEHYYFFELNRYECGASGAETLVYWVATHPVAMVFIGGFIWDCTKWVLDRLLKWIGIKKRTTAICPVLLNTKKLYRNFARATNMSVKDCQITKLTRLRAGTFHVKIRTSTDRKFKVKAYVNGSIESLEEITDSGHRER